MYKILVKKSYWKRQCEGSGVDERIILKINVEKYVFKM